MIKYRYHGLGFCDVHREMAMGVTVEEDQIAACPGCRCKLCGTALSGWKNPCPLGCKQTTEVANG